eukprot:scaffold9811_cov78-Skeletonema_dohrnii-CCMP3373.AAC.2
MNLGRWKERRRKYVIRAILDDGGDCNTNSMTDSLTVTNTCRSLGILRRCRTKDDAFAKMERVYGGWQCQCQEIQ